MSRQRTVGFPRSRVTLCCIVLSLAINCENSSRADFDAWDAAAVAVEVMPGEGLLDSEAMPVVPALVAVTFNTGTSLSPPQDEPNDGFHKQQSEYCDEWYGNGLAWLPFIEQTRTFFEEVDPDVVAFQEIFWTGECPEIPAEAQVGFICEDWESGDPTVVQLVLSADYQIVCNAGRSDICAAVHKRFGTFQGCESDFCLEGMAGFSIEGCSKGARIGRGVIDLVSGGTMTLVNVHGTSGFTDDDMDCRVQQFEQVFVDLGDGEPAANGTHNLILGDFNTDPARLLADDPSAVRLTDFVGSDKKFHFVTEVGLDAPPTYGGFFNIDHEISDLFEGPCWTAGVTEGHPLVTQSISFDHRPIVCTLDLTDRANRAP